MYGQEAQDPSIQIQYFVHGEIPLANFSLKYFERKYEGYRRRWIVMEKYTLDGYVY